MIKYIVFDWDGTLVNSVRFLKITFAKTFEHFGISGMTYQYIREVCAQNPNKNIFELVFADDIRDEAKKFFYAYMHEYHLNYLTKRNYAEDILKFCQQKGITCFISSSKDKEILTKEIDYFGWTPYFYKICGSGDYVINKCTIEACANLFDGQIPASDEMMVLGDGAADVEMARVWNCPAAIVKSYGRYVGPKPDYKLNSLKEFIPLLQSMLY